MKLVLPSIDQLEQRVLERLKDSPIRQVGPGSVVRMIVRAVLEEIAGQEDSVFTKITELAEGAHLGTATGEDLDGCGTFFGYLGRRREGESDPEYRHRLSQIVPSQDIGSLPSLEMVLRQTPGVFSATVRPYVFGPGSFAVVYEGEVDASELERILVTKAAPGSYFRVYKAREIPISVTVRIQCRSSATESQRATAMISAKEAIRSHILSLGIGEPVLLDGIAAAVLQADPNILDCEVLSVEVNGTTYKGDVDIDWDGVATLAGLDAVQVLM